ncbi:MAG: diacylglycerol/lipid kinase family protein [Candidatus Phaeomarinobacter sp.]
MNHLYADKQPTTGNHVSPAPVMRQVVTVIYNPTAGWRRRRKLIEVVEAMNHRGAIVTLRETSGPGDAERFASKAAEDGSAEIVVAAGGDGTINEVANGLAGSQVPLGVIPTGTANVLAIDIGLPKSNDALGELLLTGAPRPIGAGRVNKRFFLLWVGAGFDGRLVHAIDPMMKRRFGKLAFVWAVIEQVFGPQGSAIRVSDGTQEVECGWAVVANAEHYAGSYRLAPSAQFDAVGLKTLCVAARSRVGLVLALLGLAVGRLEKMPGVTVLTSHRITIGLKGRDTSDPVQVDGDDMLTLPVDVECWDVAKAPQIRLVMP